MTKRETMIAELSRDFPAAADRIDAILRAVHSPDTVGVREAQMYQSLIKIAAYDDSLASEKLAKTGSYSGFDEPGSVEIARNTIRELAALSPSHCTAGRRALEEIVSLAAKRRTDHTKCNCTVCEMRDIAIIALTSEQSGGCICQDQHRRGYCTEPGCPFSEQSGPTAGRGNGDMNDILTNGIDVDKLNATAKSELWAALKILMAARTDNSETPK